jgi:hypothetical protein
VAAATVAAATVAAATVAAATVAAAMVAAATVGVQVGVGVHLHILELVLDHALVCLLVWS